MSVPFSDAAAFASVALICEMDVFVWRQMSSPCEM
jgi:hypothetical protein